MAKTRALITALALAATLCLGLPQLLAEPRTLTEGQVKAAYLYNFAQYVEWPPSAFAGSTPLVISVIGKGSFGNALDALTERTIRQRRVVVHQISRLEELGDSHILFICTSEKKQLPRILNAAKSGSILTISDISHFAAAGGMIGLVTKDDRIGFEINLKAARKADLKLSAGLLKLANTIIQ